MNILLVDDDIAVLKVEMAMIEKLGYSTIPFSNAIEALEYFKNNSNIDLIISDSDMKPMNGEKLLIEIRKISNIPFIICSGYYLDKLELNKLGIDYVLPKPTTLSEFSIAIKKVLEIAN